MKTSLFNRTLLLSAIAAISLPLNAQTRLDPLVVTVTTPLRMSQPVDQTLAATTVITRADIERLQPESVAQLLRGTAGVEFASNGGAGSVTSLFMRGTNSNHTLVMIDGVKINSPTDGRASWNFLPVSQIERIEIVRGPQSTIWGADAIGGVVNIITRQADASHNHGEIRIGAGNQNTRLIDTNYAAASASTRFTSALSFRETDGFNARPADTSGEKRRL
ncbi:MAG: TonB-dependent receptor plug domain-containing protein [Nitrincola sp.]|nr:TonB-dependent receptor plug domain-containing protein [Nitrincola sp.]